MVSVSASFCSQWAELAKKKYGRRTFLRVVNLALGRLAAFPATKGTSEPDVVAAVMHAVGNLLKVEGERVVLDRCV